MNYYEKIFNNSIFNVFSFQSVLFFFFFQPDSFIDQEGELKLGYNVNGHHKSIGKASA